MIGHIYIESSVADHPRTAAILARFPGAVRIPCTHYGEVFNPKNQNFRLQKRRPALILARKHEQRVLPAPAGYGIGGRNNYYFSHMLNCLYDCRYCFLQGMYRSAHHVLFVNYEDFEADMADVLDQHAGEPVWFFSGYDCDSLALEPVSGFAAHFLPFFERHPDAFLELRTKSTQVRSLLDRAPLPNVVAAFSFTPEAAAEQWEHRTPNIDRRLQAAARLQQAGWPIGLRFDPLLQMPGFEAHHEALFRQVFAVLDPARIHSVSTGAFRMPRPFMKNIQRLYPDESLFAVALEDDRGMVSHPRERERAMQDFCLARLAEYVDPAIIHPCTLEPAA